MEERECQCPSGLYLISTLGRKPEPCASVVMCQCPLGLIPHFYGTPFKNLGFMRFSEPVFAGIYQNILTTAVFRAC